MKHFIICYLLLVCLLVTCCAGQDSGLKGSVSVTYSQDSGLEGSVSATYSQDSGLESSVAATYSQDSGWSVSAGVKFSFRKKRSAGLGLKKISNCVPTLPCKFKTYDTNKDGEITLDEFENKLKKLRFKDRHYSIFAALDNDDDGKITQKEFDLVTPGVANDIIFPECVKTT